MRSIPFTTCGLAVACSLCVATQAQSQSSIDIYGQVGIGITSRNNAATAPRIDVGQNALNVSLIGFRGTEDLGGGTKAVFRLEGNIATDNGTIGATVAGNNKFFNRQSFVGLDFGSAGTFTFGRQFHAATDRAIRTLDVYNVGGATLHITPLGLFGVNRFAGNDSRVDNAIKYRVSGPAGLEGAVSIGLSEDTVGKSQSLDLSQTTKAYGWGVTHVKFQAPTAITGTNIWPEHTLQSVGGNLPLGPVRLYLSYYRSKLDGTTAATAARTQSNKIWSLGAAWQATPNMMMKLAYLTDTGSTLNGVAGRDGKKNTLVTSAEYSLSKRTSLYTAYFNNKLKDGYSLDPVNQAALGRTAADTSVQGLSIGMLHKF